jgi:hypothetical protein
MRSPEDGHPADVPRLLRLRGSLIALEAELRTIPQGSVETAWLGSVTRNLLAEADRVVPPDLLGELHRLIPLSLSGDETEQNFRLALGALEAWMEVLTAQCGVVFVDVTISPVDGQDDELNQLHGTLGTLAIATPDRMVAPGGDLSAGSLSASQVSQTSARPTYNGITRATVSGFPKWRRWDSTPRLAACKALRAQIADQPLRQEIGL